MNFDKLKVDTSEKKESLVSIIKDIVIVISIVMILRYFIVMPFRIDGDSMMSNFYNKEFILVNRLSYLDLPVVGSISEYKRGDVVVFRPHVAAKSTDLHGNAKVISSNKTYFIKRIIGLPGDTVAIEDGQVYIKQAGSDDFVQLEEDYLDSTTEYLSVINKGQTKVAGRLERQEYEVPYGQYFVMGDNRNGSSDSRTCFASMCSGEHSAFVPEDDISGKVFLDLGYFHFEGIKPVFTAQMRYDNKMVPSVPRLLSFPKSATYDELSS